MDRVMQTTRERLPRFHSCVRPIRGNEAISHPAAATPECQAPLAKIQRKANLQCSRAPTALEPAYFRAYALVRGRPLTGPSVALRAPKINLVIHYTPRQRSRAQ